MRYVRANASNTVQSQYRVMAPASMAMADWANFGGATNFVDLNPSGGARRDAAGSRIGIITQSNFPGTTGAFPYAGTPGTVDVNYFRVTPDPITCETDAPTTTATLDPAAPATGDTYDRAVKVNLSAVDTGTNAAGVEKTEYRITTNGVGGRLEDAQQHGRRLAVRERGNVSNSGTHLVEFRSTDKAANVEATKSVTFKVQLPVCDRSDEFDGTDILPRWVRHTRNGGTPTTGPLAPTVSGGQLHLPTNDLEIDAADAQDLGRPDQLPRPGPARSGHRLDRGDAVHHPLHGRLAERGPGGLERGQQLLPLHHHPQPQLVGDLRRVLQGRSEHDRGRPHGWLQRATSCRPTRGPVDDQDALHACGQRQHGDRAVPDRRPGLGGHADWVNFPNITGGLDLNPSSGARRDAAGSRIGLIAQDNWPAGGAFPSNGTPAIAHVDYFRVTPDNCPTGADTTAPTTPPRRLRPLRTAPTAGSPPTST